MIRHRLTDQRYRRMSVGSRLSVLSRRCALAAIAALCLAGCGSSQSLPAEQLPRAAGGTVARVGSQKIDQAAYDHLFAAEAELAGAPIPVPPHFELCVKQLGATAKRIGIKTPPSSILLPKCRERYEELQGKTLDRLVVGNWAVGAAKELGLSVSDAEMQAKLAEARRARFSDMDQYKRWLAKTGMTQRELEAEARAALLAGKIRSAVIQKLGPLTRSKVIAYYEAHPELGSVPGTWDLEIVNVDSLEQAVRVKRAIASGRSFADIVTTAEGLSSHQPVGSVLGHDPAYGAKGRYAEPELDKAITTAKPKTLEGPLKIVFGTVPHWFVYRVVKVHPAVQKPFSAVEAGLGKTLPTRIQQEALDAFKSSWVAKWKPQTRCAANYKAPLCDRSQGDVTQASLDVRGPFQ
jgi:hypothetical protein